MSFFGMVARRLRQRRMKALVLLAVCAVGFALGRFSLVLQHPILKEPAFQNLSYAYNEIMDDYLDGADSKALVNGAAEGMVASLNDPYSVFLTGTEGEQYMQSYEDHFVGIGVEMRQEDGSFIVEETIKGAPAEKAGIKPGDRIETVDGKPAKGIAFKELMELVRGEQGSVVKLDIRREGLSEPLSVSVVRGDVPIHTVSYEMKDGSVGEIAITRFADKTGDEFDAAIKELTAKGMKALLIDLRGNPGGLLEPTIHIANRFVPKGETIVQVVYKDEKQVITHRSEQKKPWMLPIAILVDGHTASSAEVLTAALKSTANAQVVGEKTFGKGIVQQFRQLGDGSVLKLTEAQWRSPDGGWIHKKGIYPTVTVEAPAYTKLPSLAAGLKLTAGDYGKKVETVQQMLHVLGFSAEQMNGIFDAGTKTAVQSFQRSVGLPETGVVNDRTAYRMMKKLAAKFAAEDPQSLKAMELLAAKGVR